MTDSDVRAVLKRKLIDQYGNDSATLILEEFALRHGAARVDLAVINGSLHGWEIKSDADSLSRLPSQAWTYNSVFDRVTLVAGERHVGKAKEMVPEWWGIMLAKRSRGGTIRLLRIREPNENPSPEPVAIAKLLWRDEALSLLVEVGAGAGLRASRRSIIYSRLAEAVDLDYLRARVRQRLRDRPDWRADVRHMSGGD
jgi:hypothetical protein